MNTPIPDTAASPSHLFGILGGFPGDEALLRELEWCGEAFGSRSTTKPPLARLVALLTSLPLAGRQAVVRHYLASSPHRDAILRDLFDYCFQQQHRDALMGEGGEEDAMEVDGSPDVEEDEFVMIANPHHDEAEGLPKPLNLKKFHIFQVVIILMAVSGPAGAEMSRKYLCSASTRHRAKILIQCAVSFVQDFTDAELWEHYCASSRSVQGRVVEACKQSGKRREFLRLVYEQQVHTKPQDENDLLYWLNTDYLASKMAESKKELKMKRWGAYGDMYLDYIRRKMDVHKEDQLELGVVWRRIRGQIELISIKPSHIFALFDILEEYKPYCMSTRLGAKAQKYVKQLSKQGEDVSDFDEVTRIQMDQDLLRKLTNQERYQLAEEYLEARDWEKFWTVKNLVSRHRLPYKAFHSATSAADLWSMLSYKHQHTVDPFASFFLDMDLFSDAANCLERSNILKSWADLHLRCKPSDLTDDQLSLFCDGMSSRDCWSRWFESYVKFFKARGYNNFVSGIFSIINAECNNSLPDLCSRLKTYCLYVQDLLGIAVQATNVVSSHLEPQAALEPVLVVLRGLSYDTLHMSVEGTAHDVAQKGAEVITELVLPKIRGMFQFDPSVEETYITSGALQYFESTLGMVLLQWGSSDTVMREVAATILDVSRRISECPQGDKDLFKVVEDNEAPRKKRKLVWCDFALHRRVEGVCNRLASRVLQKVEGRSFERNVLEKLWKLAGAEANSVVDGYLDACLLCLPGTVLFEDEQPVIVNRSRAFILSTVKKSPNSWKDELSEVAKKLVQLGLLESVLNDEEIPSKVQVSLLVDHAGFGNEKARQSLKDATYVADGEARAEGLTKWLDAAFETDSPELIAEAMSFAASRVKNEAGIHRRTVFAWLEQRFAQEACEAPSRQFDSNVSSIHTELVCSSLLSMQRNDLSRLDSVARQCFARLPYLLLESAFQFDPSKLSTEQRQLRADCAIQLHWELEIASGGEQNLHHYSLPISQNHALPSAAWVARESFQAAYPTSKASTARKISTMSRRVNLDNTLRANLDLDNIFGPKQCVRMLESSINKVWNDSLPSCALRLNGRFPDDEDVANSLRCRLECLFVLSGTAWQEVELLTTVFDKIFLDLQTASTEHCSHASKLLQKLFSIHGSGAPDIPRLVQACDSLFRSAVVKEETELVQEWLDEWQKMYLQRESRVWDNLPFDERLQSFLHKHGGDGCEPEAWRKVTTKSDTVLKECNMARELLAMSPSALLLPRVQEIILSRRQDILKQYINDEHSLQGIFNDSWYVDAYDSVDELLFRRMDDKALLSCTSDISQRCALFARREASNSQLDLQSKIDAIGKFMKAPSTQHADVLDALQSDLDDAVREALINRVFDLDSPWHILGFLLSQKAIEKNDQRVTALLLGYVAQHVHVDKVVQVIGILLKEPRWKKLGFQLHKGAVRMLFDAKTDSALQLLRQEWDKDLPDGVRSLIVEKCVQSLAVDGWEAAVLYQVAKNESFEVDLKLCLLAPYWSSGVTSLAIPKADGTSTDELLDSYRQRAMIPVLVSSKDNFAVETFRSVLEELELSSEGPLRLLAKLKKLSLSNLFSDKQPSDDQGALNEMADYLKQKPTKFNRQLQVGVENMALMLATGACRVVNAALPKQRAGEKQTAEKLDRIDSVKTMRDCVRTLIATLLDLPVRQRQERAIVLRSLDILVRNASYHCDSMVYSLLFKPFHNELKILKNDSHLVESMLSPINI